jgi:hypothetical protein
MIELVTRSVCVWRGLSKGPIADEVFVLGRWRASAHLLSLVLNLLDAILGLCAHPDQLGLLLAGVFFLLGRGNIGIGGAT